MKPQWITEKEVSRMTAIAEQTLRNDRHNRKGIPYSKIGKRSIRYLLDDVVSFMQAGRIEYER